MAKKSASSLESSKENGKGTATAEKVNGSSTKKTILSVSDLPSRSLRDALRVPQAVTDNYAGGPTAPHDIALALEVSPTSSSWRDLAAVAMGYGLTKGSWSAQKISLEPLGRRATAPTEEGDDIRAKAEAALRPRIYAAFFKKYNKAKFPPDQIAKNVLQSEFGVPADRVDSALRVLKDNGQYVGFIRDTKTGPFVAIDDPQPVPVRLPAEPPAADDVSDGQSEYETETPTETGNGSAPPPAAAAEKSLRVFISHGKNKDIVEQVKDILSLYDIEYEVAVEEETAAIPVPEKVMSAMRRCQAGIMAVTADEHNRSEDGFNINTNVLIEIGTAFVLYDQRVVLLWDKRLKVPSNLQGLYRVEFEGSELSFSTGTRLAKSVKSLKKP